MSQRATVLGCSAFGLHDSVATPEGEVRSADFFLADVLLPGRPFGTILTGNGAQSERVHSGLPWPPEAQVHPDMRLRRAPIACVWRSLVEAKDKQARWKIGEGVSFPLGRILAAHVVGLLEPNGREQISPVVAIPNDLDELGQEILKHELERLGFPDPPLIWRPIASALAWLEEGGKKIVQKGVETEIQDDDFIIVLHVGADAVECTSFRIKVEEHQGIHYMVPRRNRPKQTSDFTGFDWACRALEQLECIPPEGFAEFWQAFTAFPEIWQCMANRKWDADKLPRIWGQSQGWSFWNPDSENLLAALGTVQCGPSKLLQRLLAQSCRLSGTEPRNMTWPERLRQLTLECLEQAPSGRLIGMIADGPLAQSTAPQWLQGCFSELRQRGLDPSAPYDSPEFGRLWCSPGNTSIAHGAAIFGHRLNTGEPTYLDTLPQLSLLAKKESALSLFPLVGAQDVRGGEEYTNSLKKQFVIEAHQPQLDIILYKGIPDSQWLTASQNPDHLDSHVCSMPAGLSLAASSAARHFIRTQSAAQATLKYLLGRPVQNLSLAERNQLKRLAEQVAKTRVALRDLRKNHGAVMARYIESFGSLYRGEKGVTVQTENTSLSLKKVSSPFPLPPPKTMPVDINVSISPASGRARMEVVPEDAAFLRGRHVFVDYATMEDLTELPTGGQGWPPLEEIAPHTDKSVWNSYRSTAEKFLNEAPGNQIHASLLDRIYAALRYKLYQREYDISFSMLNQKGVAGCNDGTDVVDLISRGVAKHAATLMSSTIVGRRGARLVGSIRLGIPQQRQLSRLIVRGSWLWGATPETLLSPMRYVFQERLAGITWGRVVDAAGRAFTRTEDLSLLFQSILKRIREGGGNPFPMQAINAACLVLMYRQNGQDALDDDTARTLLLETCKTLNEHAMKQRFKRKFFQGIRLLLYLLRYRKNRAEFFKKDSLEATELLKKLTSYENGIKHVLAGTQCAAAIGIMEGIKDFVNFAGSTTTLGVLTAIMDENGEDEDERDEG